MALEDEMKALTAAVKELTATVKAGGGMSAAAAPASKKADKAAATTAPKYTAEQTKARVLELREKVDMDAAKKVIAEAGATDLANLLTRPELFEKAYDLASAAITAAETPADPSDGL